MSRNIVRVILLMAWPFAAGAGPLIIDHNAVAKYSTLSQQDIDRVKTEWVDILGASHSLGYRTGCELLQSFDSRFQVSVTDSGPPEGATTNHLRISRANRDQTGWVYGGDEQTWYTTSAGMDQLKSFMSYCDTNNLALAVFGFGWSWQVSWHNSAGGGTDPVYHVQWAGSSQGGPDGDLRWGLDAQSYAQTSNHVSMDTYISATEQYRAFCMSNGYPTKVIFTTAPVDYLGDSAYQVFLKNSYIRTHVSNTTDGILFDYADILCWDDAGTRKTNGWTDLAGNPKYYEWIADDNYLNLDGTFGGTNAYHIGQRGAVRLAKALWWMLAVLSEPPPKLHMQNSGDSLVINFTGIPQNAYEMQYTDDLLATNWQVIGIFTSDVLGACQLTNTPSPGTPRRFYGHARR